MSWARAPGKLLLSGAYSVLWGGVAIVTAVDRYVSADSARDAPLLTPEVRAAGPLARAPWFDASQLRQHDVKLGLGSSAAILVASLAALELDLRGELPDESLAQSVFPPALAAHRRAQGGGSGVDVAASCFGGSLRCRLDGERLDVSPYELPGELAIEVWSSGHPASTPALLGRVRQLERAQPQRFQALLARQREAAGQAERARCGRELVEALEEQRLALTALGAAAGAPIVTAELQALSPLAEHACVLPSGAGGGDVVLYVGLSAPSPALEAARRRLGWQRLELGLGARGVHAHAPGA